ncbi:PREDICTED: TBC1 domain family member 8B-like isoform X1 [Ipomoea nil]|uniref:TBC1 domain family member 8B-like isoform X1 n=1 Tax=Ipomoea nil TaxID=35883 RepID=UPI0009017331|nr:PREDICTED: TBC1 domain family member 8B-like isoform X1 [Ipomoea nil]
MLLSLLSKRYLEVDSRDAYGFTVRPQHAQRYREYASIYKEEEEERSDRWKSFLNNEEVSDQQQHPSKEEDRTEDSESRQREADDSDREKPLSDIQTENNLEKEVPPSTQSKRREVKTWTDIKSSLCAIETVMASRVKKKNYLKGDQLTSSPDHLLPTEESKPSRGESGDEDENDNVILDDSTRTAAEGCTADDGISVESSVPWKDELEILVHGGVPRDLRGEVWQAFVGVRARRVERYYQDLLVSESENDTPLLDNDSKGCNKEKADVPEKCRKQIEKDLARTFPGHPALDENGRNSLRRLLMAYARHNPSVGYCQAMNFFAGILLLMMPEENAFWALLGIMDDYFDGCFSQEMIESQVDQLVFEELMRERFPKLVNHLDYLGVQVTWLSAPWFLSIFVNMLPWESVLRVWDVLLFEGNRVMLFRTALALMELYGPAIVTANDAGDAITLLQSLAGSTFDSSQLVLTACMGFLNVTEDKLKELREKHRPSVMLSIEERSKVGIVLNDQKSLATRLYSFKHDPQSRKKQSKVEEGPSDKNADTEKSHSRTSSTNLEDFLNSMTSDSEVDSVPDLQEQVVWLKVELCNLLEEKRAAVLRAEELETALMEMVKEDNRRELSARVEELEEQMEELQQTLADKKEQENAMSQLLVQFQQEQKITEEARIAAEQDAVAQKYAAHILQEKYEKAMASLAQMEKRAVMAESMLEATMQYESGQVKALASPGGRPESPRNAPLKKMSLLSFGLGWRDKNKGKPPIDPSSMESKPTAEGQDTSSSQLQNGLQDDDNATAKD